MTSARPTLAVWKLASCGGCQLSLLNLEDELLGLVERVDIATFREASSREAEGPFDLSLVDGSITTAHDEAQIREVRRRSRHLVALGACGTAGGIQALRNFQSVREMASLVYARPETLDTLAESRPISAVVPVDFELRGCPPNKEQLLEVVSAFLAGRKPNVSAHSVCLECKLRGNVCVLVLGQPCLGPITHAGCGALCPSYQRGCYGCFGPMEAPNTAQLARTLTEHGVRRPELVRLLRTFNAAAPAFRDESEKHE